MLQYPLEPHPTFEQLAETESFFWIHENSNWLLVPGTAHIYCKAGNHRSPQSRTVQSADSMSWLGPTPIISQSIAIHFLALAADESLDSGEVLPQEAKRAVVKSLAGMSSHST